MAAGFTKLKAKLSELLPTDFVVDNDMESVDSLWSTYLQIAHNAILKLSAIKKLDQTPVEYLSLLAENKDVEYDENHTDIELRRLIFYGVRDSKKRNTITNVRDAIERITGVRPDIKKRKIDYAGWAQDNEVIQFPFGFLWNQNQDEEPDGFLWYQGGKIPIFIDLKGFYSSDILDKVYAVVAAKKLAVSVVEVGYAETDSVWHLFKTIYSTDLTQTEFHRNRKRY
jgi:hypothetical protein